MASPRSSSSSLCTESNSDPPLSAAPAIRFNFEQESPSSDRLPLMVQPATAAQVAPTSTVAQVVQIASPGPSVCDATKVEIADVESTAVRASSAPSKSDDAADTIRHFSFCDGPPSSSPKRKEKENVKKNREEKQLWKTNSKRKTKGERYSDILNEGDVEVKDRSSRSMTISDCQVLSHVTCVTVITLVLGWDVKLKHLPKKVCLRRKIFTALLSWIIFGQT